MRTALDAVILFALAVAQHAPSLLRGDRGA